jgi:hypothetical protein
MIDLIQEKRFTRAELQVHLLREQLTHILKVSVFFLEPQVHLLEARAADTNSESQRPSIFTNANNSESQCPSIFTI